MSAHTSMSPSTLQDGLRLQQTGAWPQAAMVYQSVLAREPRNGRARTLLGLTLCQSDRAEEGIPLIRQTALEDDDAFAHYSLGVVLSGLDRLDEAVTALRCSAHLMPGAAPTHVALGHALARLNQHEPAITAYQLAMEIDPATSSHVLLGQSLRELGRDEQALAVYHAGLARDPNSAGLWSGLANALVASGHPLEAVAAAERALSYDAKLAQAHFNLANALRALSALNDAAGAYRAAIALQPVFPEAYCNLSGVFYDLQLFAEAAETARAAIAQRARYAEGYTSLGNALQALFCFPEAEAAYRAALELKPSAAARSNLSVVLTAAGRLEEALAEQRQALEIAPAFLDARYNHAVTLLKAGDYAAGWPRYESRWELAWSPPRGFSQPQWAGEALHSQTILLHPEQGLGDTLQMVRYAPLVAARGGRVILEVQRPLVRLMQGMPGVEQVIALGDTLPPFDLHCPLFSLPAAFGTLLGTVPSQPYLQPDPALAQRWQAKMMDTTALRVGLVWSGAARIGALVNTERSILPAQLAPLGTVPDVCFYSLQKHETPVTGPSRIPGLALRDFMAEITDFADTAALVAQLDLVISVDTSTAHLAAAMGKPVWLLSRYNGCWRWLTGRADSPWYPRLTVFRQDSPSHWEPVVAEIAEALRVHAQSTQALRHAP